MTKVAFRNEESWVILSPIEQSIKRKIEEIGTPLKDWDINIYRGILTGYNEAFIISGDKKSELLAACSTEEERVRTDELIRPILRGRDIRRYKYDFNNLYIILAYYGSHHILESQYSAIYNHLKQYEIPLKERGQCRYTSTGRINETAEFPGQHHWLELDNNPTLEKLDDFNKQKIVWGNLNLKASFSLAPGGIYINAPATFIVPYNKYLLAILNSKLADYYIRNLGVTRNGGYFEYKPMFIEKLPVPLSAINAVEINRLIDLRLAGEDVEEKLNQLIYGLYNMSTEEIKVIEEN